MKIYTATGDAGTTSLVGGTRVPKNSPRLEAYGTVDELNSWLGLIIANLPADDPQAELLTWVQNRLFDLGSTLATEASSKWQPSPPTPLVVTRLEQAIDAIDATLPRHNQFILPGGTPNAANAHIARTVARRAERQILSMLSPQITINPLWLKFINRLSDYLFVLARHINHRDHTPETYWQQ